FKVTNPDQAAAQLKRLEKLIAMGIDQVPELKGKVKWSKLGTGEFVTLTIDAKTIKFDEASVRKYEEKPGEFDAVVKRLKSMQMTISFGVRGKYVLLAVGETTGFIEKLGTGKRLIDQPEFKPLASFADQRLTSVSYSSKAYRSQTDASYFNLQKWI